MLAYKKLEHSCGDECKEVTNYVGLILTRLLLRNLSDNLLNLIQIIYREKLFTNNKQGSQLKLSKIFETKYFSYMKVTNELKSEYCCFFHFLLGKKRLMAKRNDIEVR